MNLKQPSERRGRRGWMTSFFVLLFLLLVWFVVGRDAEREDPAQIAEFARNDIIADSAEVGEAAASNREAQLDPIVSVPGVPEGPIHLAGSIEFLDQAGRAVPSAMGHITWTVVEPSGAERSMMTAVVDDQWTADVERDSILTPIRATWSSRTRTQKSDVVQTPIRATEGEKRVTAHLSYGVILNVVDSVTHKHLQEVTIVLAHPTSSPFRDTRLPPEVFLLGSEVSKSDSPMFLPNMPGIHVGWVHARSHAWARFAFTGDHGVLTVALSAGCEASVTAHNLPKDATDPTLLVYADNGIRGQADTLPIAETAIKEGVMTVVSGLPPGPHRFVISPYPRARFFGPRIAEHRADLVPGRREVVEFDLKRPEIRSGLGTIAISVDTAGLGAPLNPMTRVCVEPAAALREQSLEDYILSRSPSENGVYNSYCPNIVPGKYVVTLLPQGLEELVEVRAGSTVEVQLRGAPMCNVVVTAIHGRTGRRIDDAIVRYRPVHSNSGDAFVDVPCNRNDYSYAFRCCPGEYTITADFMGHRQLSRQVAIKNAHEAIELKLISGNGPSVVLQATQDGNDALMRELFWYSVEVFPAESDTPLLVPVGVDAIQVGNLTAFDCARGIYVLPAPGAYEFRFPRLSGLKQLPPLRVNVDGTEQEPIRFEVAFE